MSTITLREPRWCSSDCGDARIWRGHAQSKEHEKKLARYVRGEIVLVPRAAAVPPTASTQGAPGHPPPPPFAPAASELYGVLAPPPFALADFQQPDAPSVSWLSGGSGASAGRPPSEQPPPAPEAAGPLPRLWRRWCTQESVGRLYWQDVYTNETRWQMPSSPDIELIELPDIEVAEAAPVETPPQGADAARQPRPAA